MKKGPISMVILLIAGLGAVGFLYKRYRVPPAINLPVISLTDLHGNAVSLQSYSGHPLFINFFATWCGPCMRELPDLADLKSKLADENLQVVCISEDPLEKLQTLQERLGDGVTILHTTKPFHDINVYTYPTNYIYNAKGQKIYEKVGPDDWESNELVNKIRKLIE